MSDRAKSATPLGMSELLAWVAGLAALAGMIAEVIRRSSKESAAGLVGGLLVLYVIYVALSVRSFWDTTRIAMPITLLIGGVLWTFALQNVDRSDLTRAVISMIFIPLAMLYSVRLISSKADEDKGVDEAPGRPTTVHCLLEKGKGFGNQPDHAKDS